MACLRTAALIGATAALLTLAAACGPDPATATPLPTIVGAIAPTAIIDPVLPTPPGSTLESRLEFTPGASRTLPAIPTTTDQALNIAIGDAILVGDYFRGTTQSGSTIILLHGVAETRQSWGALPEQLRQAGMNVIAFDWRGYGQSSGTPNWDAALSDLDSLLRTVSTYEGIDANRISLVGMGAGGTLALAACPTYPGCRGAVALSPTAAFGKLSAARAMPAFGTRPVLLITSTEDDPSAVEVQGLGDPVKGDKRILRYPGRAHSAALLTAQPDLIGQIIDWLKTHG
jgi:pimeloyl-ACP methyl ester carboxylesterase